MTGGHYKAAGVDIDAQDAALAAAKGAIRSTFTAGVLSDIGLFGGLFDLEAAEASGQVLVASTDGVGTKVVIAAAMKRYDTVGQCLVNHCVNDILVQGARPLFFLDYVGTGRLEPPAVAAAVEGIALACRQAQCALLGGETAEMPGMYPDGHLEIVGTIVGAVPRERILDGSRVRDGDVILALPSNGLHTNGYSLARKVLFEDRGYGVHDRPEPLAQSVGEALLAVHRSYQPSVLPLLEAGAPIHACAHITGGGLVDNLPRILPEGLGAVIRKDAVEIPPILRLIVQEGGIPEEEAYRVFNMGFGFLLLCAAEGADEVLGRLRGGGRMPVTWEGSPRMSRTLSSRKGGRRGRFRPWRWVASCLLGASSLGAQTAVELLDAKKWTEAGRLLARSDLLDSAVLQRLPRLGASALTGIRKGFAGVPNGPPLTERLLRGLSAHAEGDPGTALRLLQELLDDSRLHSCVIRIVGPAGLKLCRRGNSKGLSALEDILRRYSRAPWAHANLALALRLVGRYEESFRRYRDLLGLTGRVAWVLNDLGLLHQATGDRARALEVFLEGVQETVSRDQGGRDTCAGNAAMLLLARNEPGDRTYAEVLLEGTVSRDPTRVRAAYWLAQLRQTGAWSRSQGPAALEPRRGKR